MKYLVTVAVVALIQLNGMAQNVGIGTTTPTAKLEVKNPGLNIVKISSASNADTTQLTFSNKNEFGNGTDMSFTFLKEQGIFVSTYSPLFPYLNSDSLFFIARFGNVGINTKMPTERLHVNGKVLNSGLLVKDNNVLELGYGLAKQVDNGKIGMNVFGDANSLSIVGGGTSLTGADRRIKFWADSVAEFTGRGRFSNNVGIGANPGGSRLVVNNSTGSLLSLQNSNSLNTGITSSISFGGSNYTTGMIQTIGNSASDARMGFQTGYSFSGGPLFLQERLTISNNGNIGVGTTDPQSKLEVNGDVDIKSGLKFSGSSPAAFQLTLRGSMMFSAPLDPSPDSSSNARWVLIDHPKSNNNPSAIIMVTCVGHGSRPMTVEYFPGVGKWFMKSVYQFDINGTDAGGFQSCDFVFGTCITYTGIYKLLTGYSTNGLEKDSSKWNILILN